MKNKVISILIICLFIQTVSNAQDKKIPFDKGVLKLCSTKNFVINGYDGNEVIIRSLHSLKAQSIYRGFNLRNDSIRYVANTLNFKGFRGFNLRNDSIRYVAKTLNLKGFPSSNIRLGDSYILKGDSIKSGFSLYYSDNNRGKGLKKLGKKAEAEESGVFLKIEVKGNELIIKDDDSSVFLMISDERYEISIPNSIKIDWDTNGCSSKKYTRFFTSNTSEIKDFKGEVEITSTLKNILLTDVSGPVTINTIGGNVTVKFDKTTPKYLYSIYSNNGFIDIKLPLKSSILIDATADEILSDLDFDIVSEKEKNGAQQMSLKLGSGKVKMKLNACFGNIYLRKK